MDIIIEKNVLVYAMTNESFEMVECGEVPIRDKCVDFLKNAMTFQCMRASWFTTAVNSFVESNCNDSCFLCQCMYGVVTLDDLENLVTENKTDFVIIPMILSSFLCHMTVVIIDRPRKRIVYFDPYGTSPLHEVRTVMNIKPGTTGVLHVLCSIAMWVGFRVSYSPQKEQTILHPFQCGAFSKAFIERAILFPKQIVVMPL